MARLNDSEARKLVMAVGQAAAVQDGSRQEPDDGADRLRALFADRDRSDELGRRLTLELAAYLNRPVRCSVLPASAPVADAWRFVAQLGADALWLDLDVDLAIAFADAMIGGDGTGSLGRGRRVRTLAGKIAELILTVVAGAAGATSIGAVEALDNLGNSVGDRDPVVLGGGLYAVAIDQFPWQVGVLVRGAAAAAPPPPRTPAMTTTPAKPPEGSIDELIDALRGRLAAASHVQIASADATTMESGEPFTALTAPVALGLALTTDGTGALVAVLDRSAVVILASGASGNALPAAEPVGDVVVAAAEAVVRDALTSAGRRLPSVAESGQRVVRLADNPLPARTPHHAVELRLSAGERSGVMRLLIPSSMLGAGHAGSKS